MSDRDFDPGNDWPPEGAHVWLGRGVGATFRSECNMPGWYLADGRYARPFDSTGLLLARRWAELAHAAATDDTPGGGK